MCLLEHILYCFFAEETSFAIYSSITNIQNLDSFDIFVFFLSLLSRYLDFFVILSCLSVGHYSHHQTDYHSNLVEFLGKAATVFSQRRVFNGGTENLRSSCDSMLESSCSLHDALSSSESLRRVAIGPNDHFFSPSSSGKLEVKDGSSFHDEQKPNLFTSPSINPHGYLSQVLFDVCVPKNVEGWDIKPITSNGKQSSVSARRRGPLNPIRCIRRSRL